MADNAYLVSAIVSTYKSEKFIRGKIEDLLSQSLKDKLEIVIINSGSPQNEDAIVKEYLQGHNNIKYIVTEERESIYKAWNRGIRTAKGEFITNANTDDRLRSDAYEVLSGILLNNPGIALVYADQYLTDIPNGKFSEVQKTNIYKAPDFNIIHQFERCLAGSQPMWRASLHFSDGIWFNEKYEVCGDHEFEMNIAQSYEIFHHREVLGTFYKCPEKKNKEYENPERTMSEVYEITLIYLYKYILNLSETEYSMLRKKVAGWIDMPVLLSGVLKKMQFRMFPDEYSPTLQFTYLIYALFLEIEGKKEMSEEVCRRFLKVRASDRLRHYLEILEKGKSVSAMAEIHGKS